MKELHWHADADWLFYAGIKCTNVGYAAIEVDACFLWWQGRAWGAGALTGYMGRLYV